MTPRTWDGKNSGHGTQTGAGRHLPFTVRTRSTPSTSQCTPRPSVAALAQTRPGKKPPRRTVPGVLLMAVTPWVATGPLRGGWTRPETPPDYR